MKKRQLYSILNLLSTFFDFTKIIFLGDFTKINFFDFLFITFTYKKFAQDDSTRKSFR